MPRKATRRLLAWLMAVCVLFAQSAALAYACSLDRVGATPVAATSPCPSHVADTNGSGDAGQGNLCQIHCQTPTTADPGASVPMVAAVDARPAAITGVALAVHRVAAVPTPSGAPPPVLRRTSRLLI